MKKYLILIIILLLIYSISFSQAKLGGTAKVSGTAKVGNAASGGGGGSFPTNSILDNFNRTNEGPPPSASWAGPIFSGDGQHSVASNMSLCSSSECSTYYNTNYGPDIEVYVKMTNPGGGFCCTHGVMWRINSPNSGSLNGYFLFAFSSTGLIKIYRIDSGSPVQLGADFSQTIDVDDSVGVKMVGSTITLYYKTAAGSWTSLGTRSDSTYTGAGKLGIINSTGAADDDFGGGTL